MNDQFFRTRNEGGPLSLNGSAVCRARREANLTQKQLASRMWQLGYELPQPYISLLENGRYRFGFTERMVTSLASALGVGITDLTGGRLLSRAEAQRLHELTGQMDELIEPSANKAARKAG
jgi:transcriptional regulator with XRE-family HTH domain